MANEFPYSGNDPSGVASRANAIVPHDVNDLAYVSRAIYVGGSGDVTLTTLNGDKVAFKGLVAGSILPVRASRVWSTGTTATNLVGLR